jgi:nucleoside phosphorylase
MPPSDGVPRIALIGAMQEELSAVLAPQAHVHAGLIISGDQFVASASESQRLQSEISDALAVG